MIINVRGTNGAGKSTVVRQIMERYDRREPITRDDRRRPLGYVCTSSSRRPLFIPGHYEIANGGIDTLGTLSQVMSLVWDAHDAGHDVVFEGKNMQDGTVTKMAARLFDREQIRFVTIAHPVELCILSVRARGHRIAEKTIRSVAAQIERRSAALVKSGYQTTSVSRDDARDVILRLLSGDTT